MISVELELESESVLEIDLKQVVVVDVSGINSLTLEEQFFRELLCFNMPSKSSMKILFCSQLKKRTKKKQQTQPPLINRI